MSSDSIALFRKGLGPDLNELAEKHYQHDLTSSDREAIKSAASTVSLYTSIGSAIGLTLSLALAYRIRSSRARLFRAFKTTEKPTHVRFADGREETLPDLTPLVKPSRLGDFATFGFLGLGGIFLGGETGLLTGSLSAKGKLLKDEERRERIQNAMKAFRVEALRKQADELEGRRGLWI
ncbi:hypothetical protein CB0940_02044 [Cercospora beticola]|uniref:Altered inheritance of mitochondria protein 11 n=1 Tax=Cercospora beticola TaxID=122368 RepID=A0A2G5ICT9_CERBT|nr:hypothetical protein CB0940_02044 [Cercospora beticola]PIB02648.1 hypothetical protein CB0940_02044 [Cercospora beticola]WPA97514.1 hypothetical protein RHO25_002124 [Cercospora beticola]